MPESEQGVSSSPLFSIDIELMLFALLSKDGCVSRSLSNSIVHHRNDTLRLTDDDDDLAFGLKEADRPAQDQNLTPS